MANDDRATSGADDWGTSGADEGHNSQGAAAYEANPILFNALAGLHQPLTPSAAIQNGLDILGSTGFGRGAAPPYRNTLTGPATGCVPSLDPNAVALHGNSSSLFASLQGLRKESNQCVALAKAAVGVSGSVREWRKGDAASSGTLKIGTPIATFLNSDGSQSDRYAGGGTGTAGVARDHAAVFNGYVTDGSGKVVGIKVFEQYAKSGGAVKENTYMFGKGYGENNASNYFAIKDQSGAYLGGNRNPMNATHAVATPVAANGADKHTEPANKHTVLASGVPQLGAKSAPRPVM